MDPHPQTFSAVSAALRQWIDAQIRLSQAIKSYAAAAALLEPICTSFSIKSIPGTREAIENNLKIMEREELDLHKTQVALRMKRNSFASPIYTLPSELLAQIFTTAVSSSDPSGEHVMHQLSWVCSRWRQLALEVCPVFLRSRFSFGIDDTLEDRRPRATITLINEHERRLLVPVDRQPDVDDAPYAQTTLDTLAPYIKQLSSIRLNGDFEQLRPFLNFWLEKGTPGSVTSLYLSVNGAAPAFYETSPHLSERLNLFIRQLTGLVVSSLGLAWSSMTFDNLYHISLSDLPPSRCPTLEQLSRMLSTCATIRSIHLECITIPDSKNAAAPETVELKYLRDLSLIDVDVSRVLSIIAPGHDELNLTFRGVVDDTATLESLCSLFGRANLSQLTLMLLEPRSDQALARLLLSALGPIIFFRNITLKNMHLYDSELSALAYHSPTQKVEALPSSWSETTGGPRQRLTLVLQDCTICTTPKVFYDAVSAIPWGTLRLPGCRHLLTTQGEDGATEVLQPTTSGSDFGIQLAELLADRSGFQPYNS
ncbi:hypothetical protein BDV93DRAFT_519464 [Ceratobasidium sp. AG-I]|nr:hypothetical protein BDV93DRAFT_519464 [Ceratobasidium sp. AG-I]